MTIGIIASIIFKGDSNPEYKTKPINAKVSKISIEKNKEAIVLNTFIRISSAIVLNEYIKRKVHLSGLHKPIC